MELFKVAIDPSIKEEGHPLYELGIAIVVGYALVLASLMLGAAHTYRLLPLC